MQPSWAPKSNFAWTCPVRLCWIVLEFCVFNWRTLINVADTVLGLRMDYSIYEAFRRFSRSLQASCGQNPDQKDIPLVVQPISLDSVLVMSRFDNFSNWLVRAAGLWSGGCADEHFRRARSCHYVPVFFGLTNFWASFHYGEKWRYAGAGEGRRGHSCRGHALTSLHSYCGASHSIRLCISGNVSGLQHSATWIQLVGLLYRYSKWNYGNVVG